ncbi:MAG TPA: hypothetical protein PLL06_19965, partial [Acidobacteriota bacterium]|nr:hypothetical protein [Acidobacteriota bacterium]
AIDQLQLQPEMETRSVAVLTQKAQEGSKGIFVEFDGASTPANQVAYFVNPSSDSSAYVVLEICINHER